MLYPAIIQRTITYSSVAFMLTACIAADPMPNDPDYAPVMSNYEHQQGSASNGSLYQAGYVGSLFTDRRAARVGDVLTVMLDERTTASKSAETKIKKESDLQFDAGTVFGRNITYNGDEILSAGMTQDRDFKGNAENDQSNRLQGSITVTVSEVLPNGLLMVRGEKWMTLSNGEEFIRVKGLVRQEDISPSNTISSTKLADARITYSGTGDFADASKQGWGTRFFNSKWWPF